MAEYHSPKPRGCLRRPSMRRVLSSRISLTTNGVFQWIKKTNYADDLYGDCTLCTPYSRPLVTTVPINGLAFLISCLYAIAPSQPDCVPSFLRRQLPIVYITAVFILCLNLEEFRLPPPPPQNRTVLFKHIYLYIYIGVLEPRRSSATSPLKKKNALFQRALGDLHSLYSN